MIDKQLSWISGCAPPWIETTVGCIVFLHTEVLHCQFQISFHTFIHLTLLSLPAATYLISFFVETFHVKDCQYRLTQGPCVLSKLSKWLWLLSYTNCQLSKYLKYHYCYNICIVLSVLSLIFIACLFKGSQEQSFFLQTLLFTMDQQQQQQQQQLDK